MGQLISSYWFHQVEEGSRIPLTLDDIKVMDLDTLTGQLEVVVDEGPHFGVLEQVLRGETLFKSCSHET